MSAPLVALRGAGVSFGGLQALRSVDLELRRGDRLALVGANGSGKTTLLRLLHGLLPCSSGERELAAELAQDPGRPMAMLFQRPFLLNASALANLRIALWLQGLPAAERAARAEQGLRRVGLLAQARQPARTLSGGQQQRLALARAWALQPQVLLLDEPTAHLDPGAKREVEALMQSFADGGMTLVFATHNLGQAKRLASRVAYLEGGRLVVQAAVDRFFRGPLPDAAQQFLKGEGAW